MTDRAEPGAPATPGLATLATVIAARDNGEPSTRYYLSSARLTPEAFTRAVRGRWVIEKSPRWVLDVTFDEDRARNRQRAGWSDAFARTIIRQMRSPVSRL